MSSTKEEIDFDRAYVRRYGLYGLLKLSWHIVCPLEKFQDGPHVKEVCDHVGAVVFDLISRLLINVPPGSSKSLITSVLLPAYVWGPCGKPQTKFMFAAYATKMATRDANRCRDLIRSEWFQQRWPVELDGVSQSTFYTTKKGGWRFSEGIGAGTFTGRHPDYLIVDDSVSAQDAKGSAAELKTKLLEVQQTWDEVLSSRGRDPNNKKQILIGQRLHDEDIMGYLLTRAAQKGGVQYQLLRLPMLYEAESPCVTYKDDGTPFGGDWRTTEGELLCPERWSHAAIEELKFVQGNAFSAQYQQRPSSKAGQIFLRSWFRFWDPDLVRAAGADPYTGAGFDMLLCSWDFTFKDTSGSDFVCGQVWGKLGPNYLMLERIYRRMNFPNSLTAIESQLRRWPLIGPKVIEDKANGPAIIAVVQQKFSGVIAWPNDRGKIANANAVSYLHRSGNVYYMPECRTETGDEAHIECMAKFPFAKHDDSVDAETQALMYFLANGNALYEALAAQQRAALAPSLAPGLQQAPTVFDALRAGQR